MLIPGQSSSKNNSVDTGDYEPENAKVTRKRGADAKIEARTSHSTYSGRLEPRLRPDRTLQRGASGKFNCINHHC